MIELGLLDAASLFPVHPLIRRRYCAEAECDYRLDMQTVFL